MRTLLLVASAAFALMLTAVPSRAHHSFTAEFDRSKPVKLEGRILKMEWVNPHAWIHIGVPNTDGTTTTWMIEANTPNGLLRRGFTKASLVEGTEVSVTGYMARSGENKANGSTLTFKSNGQRLFLGSSSGDEDDAKAKGAK
jgi:hypothetical protein